MKVEFSLSKIKCIFLSLPCFIIFVMMNIIFIPKLLYGIQIKSTQEILFCILMLFIFLICGAFGALIALQSINNITLKEDCIEGYYDGKIKIYYKDIECIATKSEQPNSNGIYLILHNGKSYYISNIANFPDVYMHIFLNSPNLAKDYNDIKVRKEKASKATKIYYTLVVSLIVVIFVAVFVCMGLTGARDIPEFNETDKIIFTYFIIFEFITIISLFLVAILGAKYVRNKWVFDNMLRYLKAKQDKDKNLEKYNDRLISVKYSFDYSKRMVIYKNDEEKEKYVIEFYVGNAWRIITEELEYYDEATNI